MLEKTGFENKDPVYINGRVIEEGGRLGLKVESSCSTTRHLAPYGFEEAELQHEGHT